MLGSSRLAVSFTALIASIAALTLAGTSPARADKCGDGGTCIRIENIGNPKYLHFHIYSSLSPPPHHWNVLLPKQPQLELRPVAGTLRSRRLYIPATPGSTHHVSVQFCEKLLDSKCGSWTRFALTHPGAKKPAAKWAAVAVDRQGRWGYALGHVSEAQAKAVALSGCGTGACKIEAAARSHCVGFAESRSRGYWYGIAIADRKTLAALRARNGCAKGAPKGTCRLVKVDCAS